MNDKNTSIEQLITESHRAIGIPPDHPAAKALLEDTELGTLFSLMSEFIANSPTCEVDNVELIDVAGGRARVRLTIPIPMMFDGYCKRRLALLAEGQTSMAGQVIVHDQVIMHDQEVSGEPH